MSRTIINFRIGEAGQEWLDRVAEETRMGRSDVIRAALAMAREQESQVKRRLAALKEAQ